jgi:antirestriction protein ArdC
MKNDASTSRQDVYSRITSQIVASLEQGVRPWVKPWNAEHAAGRITQPRRFNGQPYSGINILSLWMSATAQGFASPIWMTFRQAIELNAHVRKGRKTLSSSTLTPSPALSATRRPARKLSTKSRT